MILQNVKNILIGLVHDEVNPSAALNYGLSLAAHARAHVTVQALSLKLAMTHALITDWAAELVNAENTRRHEVAKAAVHKARQDALAIGVSCTPATEQRSYPDVIATFAAHARVHDLTVLEKDVEFLSLEEGILDEALFQSGRPAIVVPPNVHEFRCKRVLVAWDGSSKAARAVNDALPFLRAADKVEIVSVEGEKDLRRSVPGSDLAPHLERHGVEVIVDARTALDGDVAATLRDQAGLFGADMIVMGAFLHSRLREIVLGGVTRSMLKDSRIPLFLAH
jgi:nucleotide-binding universal stress UspA family protein